MAEDLTAQRFGRLVVVGMCSERTGAGRVKWNVVCDCGNAKAVQAMSLKNGDTTSCGCVHKKQLADRNRTHDQSGVPEYGTWAAMWSRCTNPNVPCFKHYGGRGITVCESWRDFATFLRDMGRRPFLNASIERINNEIGYQPDNCRWATQAEQTRNARSNIKSGDLTLAEIAARKGVAAATLYSRVGKLGWTVERAVSAPVRTRG